MKTLGILPFSAPLCLAGYGVIRMIGRADGRYGPGFDWQLAHLVALAGMVLFVPLVLTLGRMLPAGPARTATLTVTFAGLAAAVVQFGADILFAARAADKAEMSRYSDDFQAIPGVELAIYAVGPQLFFLGLVVLSLLLTRIRLLPWWSPAVLLVSVILPVLSLDLMTVTGLGILAALAPLARLGRPAPVDSATPR